MDDLIAHALELGASAARIIDPAILPIDEAVTAMCREPLCPSHGQCAHCPPHAMGVEDFNSLAAGFTQALLFKIHVPPRDFFSEKSMEWFRNLHAVASGVEARARTRGYGRAAGFAAGSCLAAFCPGLECAALEENGACRHPEITRTSLEAVGVRVFDLMDKVGWKIERITSATNPDEVKSGTLVGLILVS